MADSHVLRAAREPVELDECQANAVAARIELDLRIGAAFTRLQTLQLQAVVAVLKEKVISYGMAQFYCSSFTFCLTLIRVLSIPNSRVCSGSILTGQKLQTRNILEYQSYAAARRQKGQFSVETCPSV